MTKYSILPQIFANTIPKVIVIGNGINRAFGNEAWGDLLGSISCVSFDDAQQECVEKLPFPLQAVVATGDNVDEGVELLARKWLTYDKINLEHSEIIKAILNPDFDAIITTNYSYEIERAINPYFECKIGRKTDYRESVKDGSKLENQLGIYKYMRLSDDEKSYRIWHAHGELCRPKSMVLGNYYYGKSISCISACINTFFRRYNGMKKTGQFTPQSWVDYFMLGNVYIVGLGLDPAEADLWWLINCKKRHKNDLCGGEIHWFEPNLDSKEFFAKKALAEAYGIKCHTYAIGKRDYKTYYRNMGSELGLFL